MFEISRQALVTEIRCRECPATMTIESDSHPVINRSISDFTRRHQCRADMPALPQRGHQKEVR